MDRQAGGTIPERDPRPAVWSFAAALMMSGCGRLGYTDIRPPVGHDAVAESDAAGPDVLRGPACDHLLGFYFQDGQLFVERIDPADGTLQIVGSVPGLTSLFPGSARLDSRRGRVYLLGNGPADAGESRSIYSFDSATGAYRSRVVVAAAGIYGLFGVDGNGVLHSMFFDGTRFSVRPVDPATGVVGPEVVLAGLDSIQECSQVLDARQQVVLVLAASSWTTYSLATGRETLRVVASRACFAPVVSEDGTTYAGCREATSTGFWRLDTGSGNATMIAAVAAGTASIAACLSAFDQVRRRVYLVLSPGTPEVIAGADLRAGSALPALPTQHRYGALLFVNCP